jgi:hypothetical protein
MARLESESITMGSTVHADWGGAGRRRWGDGGNTEKGDRPLDGERDGIVLGAVEWEWEPE